jgi:hypothetical protein
MNKKTNKKKNRKPVRLPQRGRPPTDHNDSPAPRTPAGPPPTPAAALRPSDADVERTAVALRNAYRQQSHIHRVRFRLLPGDRGPTPQWDRQLPPGDDGRLWRQSWPAKSSPAASTR